jgi:urease accessory protein
MLAIYHHCTPTGPVDDRLVLPFDLRQKSRQLVRLESGEEAALQLERGTILRGGDCLQGDDGRVIKVLAAPEPVLLAACPTSRELVCAAYHLGNRHVPIQVGDGWIRLEDDHVLHKMLLGLGARVSREIAPFEPEAGAYAGGHRHGSKDEGKSHIHHFGRQAD